MKSSHYYEKRYTVAGTFRQNQTVFNLFPVIVFSFLFFFFFTGKINADTHSLPTTESTDCDCTPTGDTEPPRIVLTDPRLQGLSHGDTLIVECGGLSGMDVNSAMALDNCDPDPDMEFVDYVFRDGDCHRSGYFREIVCGWVATDDCGNRDSVVITFLVKDDEAPVFDPMPDTLTVECNAINIFFPTATDNCDGRIFITRKDTIMPGDCPGESMIRRSWIANDMCGNQTIRPQVLMVEDSRPPTLQNIPNDTILSCDETIPNPPTVTAVDNCDPDVTVFLSETSTGDDCRREIIREWTATDGCGNEALSTQIITVVDTTSPFFVFLPSDSITVECDQPAPDSPPLFADNCDMNFSVRETYDSIRLDCGWIVTKSWTATDQCGNATFFEQKIYGIDTTNPTFDNPPADETVECDNIPLHPTLTASDNCDTDVLIEFESDTLGTLCDDLHILRTWTATDNCGNFTTYRQRVDIEDTTVPELFGVPADTTIECNLAPGMPVITATDNCDDAPEVSMIQKISGDSCFTYLERIWTATDDCGNRFSQTQTITFADFSAPFLSFSHPEIFGGSDGDTVRYECTDIVTFDVDDVTVIDNCDTDVLIELAIDDLSSDNCRADGFINRLIYTWTATDDCGNSSTISLIVLIIDTTDPVLFDVPEDITLSCELPLPTPPTVDVTDNCDASITAVLTEETDGVICNERIIRTWTATDDCGNFTVGTQVITLIDTTAPVAVSIPADMTIECDADIPTDEPIFEDACLNKFSVTENVETIPQPCGFIVQKTWTATDDCGNSSTAFQIITAEDTTPPEIHNVPANTTVACSDIPAPPTNITATDNCSSNLTVSFAEDTFGAGDCNNWEIVRTWSTVDDCGNAFAVQQILTISDDTPPVFSNVPADLTIECDEDVPASDDPTLTDNCDNDITLTVEDMRTDGDCIGEYTVARTWTATDDCGNQSQATQIISSRDRTPPVITFVHPILTGYTDGDTIAIQCEDLVLLDDEDARATDNCSPPVMTFDEIVLATGNCATDGFFERLLCTWTATDDCGNQSQASIIMTVLDDSAPVFAGIPADTTLNCGDPIPSATMPTVTDNCDPTITFTVDESMQGTGCAGGLNILRTWSATDFCGNTTTATQLITFNDNTPPTITFSDPTLTGAMNGDTLTIDCSNANSFDENSVTATDFCDDNPAVTLSKDADTNFDCSADGFFSETVYTWEATDACGNTSTVSLTIRLTDNVPPVFTNVPDDILLECDETVPTPADVQATDDCSGVNISFDETTIDGRCPGAKIITRTWTATDDCGNTATATQVITQEDTTPPTATIPDTLLNVECNNLPPIPTPTVTDNCISNPLIEFSETITDGNCPHSYTIQRNWVIRDGCGNTEFLTQIINVVDTEAPILSNVPGDISVSCDSLPPAATDLQPSDNCDMNPIVSLNETQSGTDCSNFVLTREWTVSDACGNSRTYTQNIQLTDNSAPDFSNVPSDATVDCDKVPPPSDPDINDDCDTDPVLSFDESRQNGNCTGEYTLTRTWTATDRCGNTATATQILTVVDNSAPTITLDFPNIGNILTGTTVEVECDSLPLLDSNSVVVTDCGVIADTDFDEKISVSDDCIADGYLTFMECTWYATDDCGNTDSLKIFVRVVDTQAPVLAGVPDNDTIYLSSGEVLPIPPIVTATDACDAVDLPTFTESSTVLNDCDEEVVRVWSITDNCGNTAAGVQRILLTNKIQIDKTIIRQPDCGVSNGGIAIMPVLDPSTLNFSWMPDLGIPTPDGSQRSDMPEGDYTIVVTHPNTPDCEEVINITLDDGCAAQPTGNGIDLVFNNGISPNGDNTNDRFIIENIHKYPSAKLTIFNSRGTRVYSTTNYNNDWRGTTDSGQNLPDGVYFYLLEMSGKKLGAGYIQVVR